MKRFNQLLVVLGTLILVSGCGPKSSDTEGLGEKSVKTDVGVAPPNPATLDDFTDVVFDSAAEMLVYLKDGNPPSDSVSRLKTAETKPLSAAKTKQILSRLAPLQVEKGDQQDFAKREKSLPPPKTGETVSTSFPPAVDKARPNAVKVDANAKLEVVRFAPEGELPIAPKISVTFNQPMVAVTSHADTIAKGVPVQISPEPEGNWRWIGTKTLLFEPIEERMPMATNYTVVVPAGTKSETGQTLEADASWKFATPPLTMTSSFPGWGTYDLDQLMFVEFDQDINRNQVLAKIQVKANGDLQAIEEVEAAAYLSDDRIMAQVNGAMEGRFLVFKTVQKLPYNSSIAVEIPKGTPSAEGERLTEGAQSFSFQTYGPLKIAGHRCGWRGCKPQDTFSINFTNRLKEGDFEESWVTVEDDFPQKSVNTSGNYITIHGRKPGRKKYKVTFSKDVTDEFGQKLEGNRIVEFDVGAADPELSSTSGHFVVVDPVGEPGFTIFATNYASVKVKAWAVKPSDWEAYHKYFRDWNYYGKHETRPPGKLVYDKVVKIEGVPDDLVQQKIMLREALGKNGLGNLVLEITPHKTMPDVGMPKHKPAIRTWVQSTKIGLDAFIDGEEFLGWATNLESGEPLGNVELTLGASGAKGKTNAKGVGIIKLPPYDSKTFDHPDYLLAKSGDDVAFLPESTYNQNSPWYFKKAHPSMAWFVFDDRKTYKPDEEVHIKGWVRRIDHAKFGGVELVKGTSKIKYTVYGSQGNKLSEGEASTSALGGFDFVLKLPKTPNLGQVRVQMYASGGDVGGYHDHTFQIQEFRTPEFAVTASVNEGPHMATGKATATVEAKYYAGGALPNAETTWNVVTTESSFTPPNQEKFTFGVWTPWWVRNNTTSTPQFETFQAKTDAAGMHNLEMEFSTIIPPKPMTVTLNASVMDVNRQQWTAKTNVLVHPSDFYIGLKTERYFVEKGTPLEVEVIAADIEGNRVANRPVKVRASRTKWTWRQGQYSEELVDTQECDFMSSMDVHKCTFKTDVGGQYKIAATTSDDYGRLNYSAITRWVSGGKRPISRKIEIEKIMMIPDRDEYQPDDTVEILVQAPFVPAEGLLTIRRGGMEEHKRFTMAEPTMTLKIPVKRTHIPNFHVEVDLVGNAARLNSEGEADDSLPRRPAIASGSLNLKVPPTQRVLQVEARPASESVAPGTDTFVEVLVKDAAGKPVPNAEVAIVVVDEAILSLSAYSMADPIQVFYPSRGAGVREVHLRPSVELVDPAKLKPPPPPAPEKSGRRSRPKREMKKSKMAAKPASGALGGAMEESEAMFDTATAEAPMAELTARGEDVAGSDAPAADPNAPITVRSNFNPLAAFAPAVKTNGKGFAMTKVKMPDNLTRYRIMAVAVHGGKHYGSGQSVVTARLPLMIRPSAPRFLNFGDKFELPVVVQNQTDNPMTVSLAPRASNLELASANGVQVTVPANDRVEVRFPATTAQAGTARFQVGVATDSFSDAAEVSLPVWTPATSEAFATYGEIDKGSIVQPVGTPGEVWPQFGGLEVTTSSTAMQALTDAFIYLYEYEYECAEQISSRVISVAALRDVLSAFSAKNMPTSKEIQVSMKRDVEELASRQNYDGGFGLWRKGQTSWPYVSLHAAHALIRAKQKGYEVPQQNLSRANYYLTRIEKYIPGYYPEWVRLHIVSYALYVRGLNGDYDPAKGREVIQRAGGLEKLSFEASGWLLGVFANTKKPGFNDDRLKIRKFLNNRVTETAGSAHYAAQMQDGHHLIMHSNRRADGIVLEALMDDQPKADLIPKIVKGLMAHRTRGHWGNTQENAFVLLALDKYFNIYEKVTPNFVARVWLGERFAGEHKFKGRTTEKHAINVPMKYLAESKTKKQNLYLQKDGAGRLYYRIGMTYAPKSLFVEAADHGFVVERTYEAVDNPGDVERGADGIWKIKAGAKVKVSLTMVAETRRYHVALVDPLPAGLETLNPALAVTGDLPQDQAMNTGRGGRGGWWWWSRPWYEHQNMRDERVEAFTTLLWGGVHSYSYFARATTPGEFVVPPTKAEEMYHPETFGRSASDRVHVVD